jgi:uncharacterized protein (UPF0305 family)
MESLEGLDLKINLSKNLLRDILKVEANNMHMKDIMLASSFLREDAKYMPKQYRDDYIEKMSKAFFTRIKDIKEDKNNYSGDVDKEKLREFLKVLEKQKEDAKNNNETCFLRIASLITTYTTFVLEESIHPVGTKFPGGFILHQEGGKFICPVKDRQKNNPSALCRFCVSVQDSNAQ